MQKTIERYREYTKETLININTFEVEQQMEVRFLN